MDYIAFLLKIRILYNVAALKIPWESRYDIMIWDIFKPTIWHFIQLDKDILYENTDFVNVDGLYQQIPSMCIYWFCK